MLQNDDRLPTYRYRRVLRQKQAAAGLTTMSNDSNVLHSAGLQEQLKQLQNSPIFVIQSNRLKRRVH
jgi:hypothetical protein